jgi:hypothetical protein
MDLLEPPAAAAAATARAPFLQAPPCMSSQVKKT